MQARPSIYSCDHRKLRQHSPGQQHAAACQQQHTAVQQDAARMETDDADDASRHDASMAFASKAPTTRPARPLDAARAGPRRRRRAAGRGARRRRLRRRRRRGRARRERDERGHGRDAPPELVAADRRSRRRAVDWRDATLYACSPASCASALAQLGRRCFFGARTRSSAAAGRSCPRTTAPSPASGVRRARPPTPSGASTTATTKVERRRGDTARKRPAARGVAKLFLCASPPALRPWVVSDKGEVCPTKVIKRASPARNYPYFVAPL